MFTHICRANSPGVSRLVKDVWRHTSFVCSRNSDVSTLCCAGVYAVIADSNVSPTIIEQCRQLDVPIVSCEWLIQCLINGLVLAPTGNPRYEHTYVS